MACLSVALLCGAWHFVSRHLQRQHRWPRVWWPLFVGPPRRARSTALLINGARREESLCVHESLRVCARLHAFVVGAICASTGVLRDRASRPRREAVGTAYFIAPEASSVVRRETLTLRVRASAALRCELRAARCSHRSRARLQRSSLPYAPLCPPHSSTGDFAISAGRCSKGEPFLQQTLISLPQFAVLRFCTICRALQEWTIELAHTQLLDAIAAFPAVRSTVRI